MDVIVRINLDGAEKKLSEVSRRLNSLPWRQAGEIVKQSIHRNFNSGGAYKSEGSIQGGPKKWRPRKKTVTWPILKKSAALMNSIYVNAENDRVKVGSSGLAYNAAQNYGYQKRNLPARPFLVVQDSDLRKIGILFKKYLTN